VNPRDPAKEPIFNIPTPVVALLGLLAAIHAVRTLLLSPDNDLWVVLAWAFIPARYGPLGTELPGGEVALFTSPVTHMFIHGDWMHLALNSAWLLAFGGAIAERAGALRFLLFSLVCGLAGAATFYALNSASRSRWWAPPEPYRASWAARCVFCFLPLIQEVFAVCARPRGRCR